MKTTRKTLFILCIVSLLVAGFAAAQTTDNKDNSELVLAMEDDGQLMDVADAIAETGTDDLVATISKGVTIFAPVDGSFGKDVVIEDVITEYIVPVLLDSEDMVTDATFTSMGGTPVAVTIYDEEVMVNGIPIVDLEGIHSGNVVIYKLADSFDSTPVAFTGK